MSRSVPIWLLLFMLPLAGCMSRSSYDPFANSRETFQNTALTIAIAPVVNPSGIPVAESLLVQIDNLIEGTLLGSGYRFIPRDEYAAIWDNIVAQMGGLHRAETEDIDELKFELASEQLRRDLFEVFHSDYILYPEIWIVEAGHFRGVAEWDGASQSVVGFGTRVLNVIDGWLNQNDGFLHSGMVNALSLGVTVEDMDGVQIFQNAGGIEVLKDAGQGDDNEETVLFETVLANPGRTQKAVRTALQPLVEARSVKAPRR